MTETAKQYGYIGLGEMGGAMCRRLVGTGADVVVFDASPAALDQAVADGAIAATSSAEVASACDVVSICVPAAEHIEAVMNGPQGIEAGAHDDLTVLIHSTVHPDTMRAARDRAREWDVAVHDACVAGGGVAAEAGHLVLFVGDLDGLAPDAREAVDTYGSLVIDAGPVGSGAAIKIGVNVMTYAQQAAAVAAVELVAAQGASADALAAAWRHNGQLAPTLEQFLPLAAMSRDDAAGLADYLQNVVSIAEKDLDLAFELGEGTGRGPSPVVAAIREYLPTVFHVD